MDFEEYVSANYKRLEGQTRGLVEDAFEAGQQSKQAEIEGLEKKLKYEKSAYRNIKLQFLNKQDDLDELQAEIEALKAELAKYQQEGYKLVPVEPTKAMQQSAFDVYEVCDYKNYHLNSGTEVRDMIYKAMIGAAE